ncbi:MAG: class I SAM-dependent methyltransferase [Caulobacteraceae bacterium]
MAIQFEPLSRLSHRISEVAGTIADEAHRTLFHRVVDAIDPQAFLALQDKYRSAALNSDPTFMYKYMDICHWVKDKVARAFAMGLADSPPLRILDLGAGAGHFLAVCNALGHETVGIDLEFPLYVDLCAAMGVDRRTWRVSPRQPLPPSLGQFDLITAFQVKFDALGRDPERGYLYWSPADWDFFIRDVTGERMRHPGRLWLQLNSRIRPDGVREPFTDVMAACEGAGARVNRVGSEIAFACEGPIGLFDRAEPRGEAIA